MLVNLESRLGLHHGIAPVFDGIMPRALQVRSFDDVIVDEKLAAVVDPDGAELHTGENDGERCCNDVFNNTLP